MFVVVRTAGDPLAHIRAIRTELRALDPNLPIPEFVTLDQVVADSLDRPRFFTTLLGIFSAVALTLGVTAVFAAVVPAWRAAAVDPLVALRAD